MSILYMEYGTRCDLEKKLLVATCFNAHLKSCVVVDVT